MFGSVLENYWGGKKFFLYYMVCGIGAGLINELVMYLQIAFAETPGLVEAAINRVPTVGASGAIYGLLLAYGMMFPNNLSSEPLSSSPAFQDGAATWPISPTSAV